MRVVLLLFVLCILTTHAVVGPIDCAAAVSAATYAGGTPTPQSNCPTTLDANPPRDGTIQGTVLNGSRAGEPVAGATVVLHAIEDGELVPIAQTETTALGWYSFGGLPLNDARVLRVGATRDDVFYPGSRVTLNESQASVRTSVQVFDATPGPSPLVARRHEIEIETRPNLLNVTESIVVSNPTATCFVGGAENPSRPVTLRLAIPSSFEKVTFQKEYFGRRFMLIDGVLQTTIPWPPGERELKFSYILPISSRTHAFERPLDLKCSDVSVRVIAGDRKLVQCNLSAIDGAGEPAFRWMGGELPAGHVIRVELNQLGVPFAVYGRWIALGVLASSVVIASALSLRRSLWSAVA